MPLEVVQELFYSLAYEDSSGKVALKRFKNKENAEKYSALYEEHNSLCASMQQIQARINHLEFEMNMIERPDRFKDAQIGNIVGGDVQCFSK